MILPSAPALRQRDSVKGGKAMRRWAIVISLFLMCVSLFLPWPLSAAPSLTPRAQLYLPLILKGSAPTTTPTPSMMPTPSATPGAHCADSEPPFITDFQVCPIPSRAEPAPRIYFRDPTFGRCLVRVTDREHDLDPDDSSAGLVNEYSRVQSFNADESRILVRGIQATWYLYDAATLRPLEWLRQVEVEPRWDATNPDLLYYFTGTSLMAYDVRLGQAALVHDFAADFPGQNLAAVWTRWEGSPSLDSRTWGLMAQDEDWNVVAFLIYDLQADRVIAKRALPDRPSVDSVTISPLGNYFLAYYDEYCEQGHLGDDAHPCGLMVYDRNLANGRSLLRIVGHSDTALDAQGREVLVYQDIDTDHISMLDLATGAVTDLWPIDFGHSSIGLHFSGRAFRRPGWALVSTYNGARPTSATWMDDQVFAVELRAGGRVARLAHTHSLYDENIEQDYWAEPHATVNRDFTRVLFTTNWGRSGTEETEMYLIELSADWPSRLQGVAESAH